MSVAHRSWLYRAVVVGVLCALVLTGTAIAPAPAAALYLDDTTIPGKPLTDYSMDMMALWHPNAVHRIYLRAGQDVTLRMSTNPTTNCDLHLYGPGATDFTAPELGTRTVAGSAERIEYHVATSGWHYLRVERMVGSGEAIVRAEVTGPASIGPPGMASVYGPDRYETAVRIAQSNFPGWANCEHVIIASGEDRAAADPLSASGLSWAYGAPILLVQSDSTPRSVIAALQEIRAVNGPFHLHIVGGPVSVSQEALDDIEANVTGVIYDRLAPYDDRYTLAATIARRMDEERPDDWYGWADTSEFDRAALIANGEDPTTFFDALALGPLASTTGYPVLLVGRDHVPSQTANVLAELGLQRRILAGGPATVSDAVEAQLDAGTPYCDRYSGADRYATAVAVNALGEQRFGMSPANTGIAAKLPDALTGGSYMGLRRGEILLTQTERLPSYTRAHLSARSDEIDRCYILGGPVSIEPQTRDQIMEAVYP